MSEQFYGPWHVSLTSYGVPFGIAWLRHNMTIAGSESADGAYFVDLHQSFELAVTGAEWTVTLLRSTDAGYVDWAEEQLVRTTSFLNPDGLVVRLSARHANDSILLTCTCTDPTLSTHPAPNPFDFTYPQG
jgi:hypothetical protein